MAKQWTLEKGWVETPSIKKEEVNQSLTVRDVPTVGETKTEKLLIDFDVYKSVSHSYGFEEKFLKHKGIKIGVKAIIKNNVFVNMVGTQYKLVPNEDVLSKVEVIAKDKDLTLTTTYYGWRMYSILSNSKDGVGVVVSNGVDGSTALRCDAMIIGDYNTVLVSSRIKNIYRRHSSTLSVTNLSKEIDQIYSLALQYKSVLANLANYEMETYRDALKELFESAKIPEVYTKGLLNVFFIGTKPTIKDTYETICNRIWKKDTDFKTKVMLYKKVNDVFFTLGVIDAI